MTSNGISYYYDVNIQEHQHFHYALNYFAQETRFK